jgi:hypothetical protein
MQAQPLPPQQSWLSSNAKLVISICLILFAVLIVVIIVFAILFILYIPRDMFDKGGTTEKKVVSVEKEPVLTDTIDALEKDFDDIDKEIINEKNKSLTEDLRSRHFEDDEAQGIEQSDEQSSTDAIVEIETSTEDKLLLNIDNIQL